MQFALCHIISKRGAKFRVSPPLAPVPLAFFSLPSLFLLSFSLDSSVLPRFMYLPNESMNLSHCDCQKSPEAPQKLCKCLAYKKETSVNFSSIICTFYASLVLILPPSSPPILRFYTLFPFSLLLDFRHDQSVSLLLSVANATGKIFDRRIEQKTQLTK